MILKWISPTNEHANSAKIINDEVHFYGGIACNLLFEINGAQYYSYFIGADGTFYIHDELSDFREITFSSTCFDLKRGIGNTKGKVGFELTKITKTFSQMLPEMFPNHTFWRE